MSLKKISEMTGASIATVSRILNNPDYRSKNADLQKKVFDAAREIHYVPNAAAQGLKAHKAQKSPLVVDLLITRYSSLDEDSFFYEIHMLLQKELLLNHCQLGQIYDFPSMMKRKDEPVAIKDKGLIILGKFPPRYNSVITRHYVHFVGIDRNPTNYDYDEVVCDGENAATVAMEYLYSLGHKKIAYIGDCTSESRYLGYCNFLINNRMPINYGDIIQTNQTEDEGFKAYERLLEQPMKPTAIFCANDNTAVGVLSAMKKNHRKGYLPSVISIDNSEASEKTTPMLTTIEMPKQEMAHLAVLLLLDRIKMHSSLHIRLEVPCRLIVRESCSYI